MNKKLISEFFGTFILVFIGTGVATLFTLNKITDVLGIACAFGLTLGTLVYILGNISGCHLNPAVTIAMAVNGRIKIKTGILYIIAQCIGAIVASLIILGITSNLQSGALRILGANYYAIPDLKGIPGIFPGMLPGFLTELILSFIFILTIILITGKKGNPKIAGIVIGLSLVIVHLFGILITGTGVNPARSLGPALLVGGPALSQLWLFIVSPIIGGILAALMGKFIFASEKSIEEKI